jgi:small subunit ribosomal protein S18
MENNSRNSSDNSIPNSWLFNKSLSYQAPKKSDPLEGKNIDYKNVELLKDYVSESYQITSGKTTGVSRKRQSRLAVAIKRAQKLALLPFG